ncbi:MAG TPA: type II toxin-antitoxin system prevent-host-death family antitoxin [Vicinamibacteria bacterium]|jgi:prevent-host-death family protein
MKAVTIREAKARLNALVEAAERGEQVVLMRGSKHVAAIVPLSEEDIELASSLADAQAERLWRRIEQERREGTTVVYQSAEAAVAGLRVADAPTDTSRGKRTRSVKRKTRGR